MTVQVDSNIGVRRNHTPNESLGFTMTRDLYALSNRTSDLPVFYPDAEVIIDMADAGAWTFVCRESALVDRVSDYFGQSSTGLLLKIWQYPVHTDDLAAIKWARYFNMKHHPGLSTHERGGLLDCLKVQNFAAMHDLAPKIYGLCLLESRSGSRHIAALMDDAKALPPTGLSDEEVLRTVSLFCSEHGLQAPFGDLATKGNFVNGRLVDWQYSKPLTEHREFVKSYYLKHTQFGESKYQTAPVVGIDVGIRDTTKRISDLGLDRIELKGRTILDIGCNGGQFLNFAAARGARYGCGVDWPKVARAANYLSNYIGHFNIKYLGHPLHDGFPTDQASKEPFDLVLLLSMTTHIGTPEYLHGLGKRLIVEVNHPHQVADVEKTLTSHWWYHLFGKAGDHGDRHIFHCFSKRYFSDAPC